MGGAWTGTLIVALSIAYVLVLFAVAWNTDNAPQSSTRRAATYTLPACMAFAAWVNYESMGIATHDWQLLAGYLPAFLAITLCFPLLSKIAIVTRRENVASIADFLASRYGKSRSLGPIVACVTIIGTMPYTALQLKSMASSWATVSGHEELSELLAPVIAAAVIGFVILFGARRPTLVEHNRGLMRVIALQAIVKVAALAVLSLFAVAIILRAPHPGRVIAELLPTQPPRIDLSFIALAMITFAAAFCLPRQFYVGFIELESQEDLKPARWMLPAYFLFVSLAIIPILVVGEMVLHGGYRNPELHTLETGIQSGSATFTILAFFGGFASAAALLVLEIVALATMVSNELVLPIMARTSWRFDRDANFVGMIGHVRRGAVALIVVGGWLYYRYMDGTAPLGGIGQVSFAAVAQLFPALVGAVMWKRGHARGANWGICAGSAVWLVTAALPQFAPQVVVFLFPGFTQLAHQSFAPGVVLSLGINTALYIAMSLRARPGLIDRLQAEAFVDALPSDKVRWTSENPGTVGELKALLGQFLGEKETDFAPALWPSQPQRRLRDSDPADAQLVHVAERMLSGVIGGTLAHTVIGWQFGPVRSKTDDVVRMLDRTAEVVQFNRELLHSTLDNLDQGVSVVDSDLRLVAWNARYVDLFGFPGGFLHVGKPIAEVIRFGVLRAGVGDADVARHVERRVAHIRRRQPYVSERDRPDGTVLKIVASPMSRGRYVTSFTDVTELRGAARALAKINEELEDRVSERTRELTQAVTELAAAKAQAERATSSQARFLAAASHDVLQPLQAARLFLGTLADQGDAVTRELLSNADLSIESADRLLRALLNLSRLEVGGIKPQVRPVHVNLLLKDLCREFEVVAREKGLALRVFRGPENVWVTSDADLLRSVLQNLIGNAVRYTAAGAVLVGFRRDEGGLRFEIRDSGTGIPAYAFDTIFDEFFRLPQDMEDRSGAGLGLSIARRVCNMLGHRLAVRSKLGQGSIFSVIVPRVSVQPQVEQQAMARTLSAGLRVLYVENEAAQLRGMEALLGRWGVSVSTATSLAGAVALTGGWDVVLTDYQLEGEENGLDLIEGIRDKAEVFALLVASPTQAIVERAASLGVEVIAKPVAPLFLRTFLTRAMYATSGAE